MTRISWRCPTAALFRLSTRNVIKSHPPLTSNSQTRRRHEHTIHDRTALSHTITAYNQQKKHTEPQTHHPNLHRLQRLHIPSTRVLTITHTTITFILITSHTSFTSRDIYKMSDNTNKMQSNQPDSRRKHNGWFIATFLPHSNTSMRQHMFQVRKGEKYVDCNDRTNVDVSQSIWS